jgi:hypothetical protein
MRKSILCLSALILASAAHAGDLRNTTRDGAGYEATLRNVGIPQSAGLVWPVNRATPMLRTEKTDAPVRTATPAAHKSKKDA